MRTIPIASRLLLATLILGAATACQEPLAPEQKEGPLFDWDADGCWPRGPNCQDRSLSFVERDRFQDQIDAINTNAGVACGMIKSEAQYHLDRPPDLNGEGFMVWEQAPFGTFGDMHNVPDIAHVTEGTVNGSDAMLRATIVHEIAHNLGYDHSQTTQLEQDCAGAALPI